jgi:hypothetical protein
MGNISDTPEWVENIEQIDTTDLLLGGDDAAPLNKQAAGLTKRTSYLKERMDASMQRRLRFDIESAGAGGVIVQFEMELDPSDYSVFVTSKAAVPGALGEVSVVHSADYFIVANSGATGIGLEVTMLIDDNDIPEEES